MGRVVSDLTITADGYAAGRGQTRERPFGDAPDERLHAWMFETAEESPDELAAITDAGAFVMGRNMFGPVRGAWDEDWRGWWGEDPPYHRPVFVLTHHPREPLEMKGGTTFTFVTDGIASALEQAHAAADGRDVAIAGGASTVNQYLAAGLLDELRTHVAPFTLGGGERLFDSVPPLDLEVASVRAVSQATHVTYRVRGLLGG